MTIDPADPIAGPPHEHDDLAAAAVAALTADEALTVDARLATDAAAAETEALFREAAGEYGAAVTADVAPPPELRARVLAAALAERPGNPLVPASAVEVHRIEAERFLSLLRRLSPEQWQLPLEPPELAGWTVHDLAAHLTGNESLLARQLGITEPMAPEAELDNEGRARATIARHRAIAPEETVAELELFVAAVDAHVSTLTDEELAQDIDWWGLTMMVRTSLTVRSFELWTHADDIRKVVGLPSLSPPVPSVATLSRTAIGWLPLMLAMRGVDPAGRRARVHFTGMHDATHVIDLTEGLVDVGANGGPAAADVDVDLTVDVIDFCKAIGARIPAGGLRFDATGDLELATTIVDAFPALAQV